MGMPKIDFFAITDLATLKAARNISKADGTIYSTKPKKASGVEKYIWRNVVFQVSSVSAHQCLPVCAEFDLGEDYWKMSDGTNRSSSSKKLIREAYDKIVDNILNTIPKSQWAGIIRWGHALGSF